MKEDNQIVEDNKIPNQNIQEPISNLNLAPTDLDRIKKLKTQAKMEENREEEDEVYNKAKESPFKQQCLPAWRPVPTIFSVILVFSIFGVVFIILGIVLLVISSKVKSVEYDYTNCNMDKICTRNIPIDKDIDGPVFIYYQLDGFYQNSRRYVKSKSLDQLTNQDLEDKGDCEPAVYNSEMGFGDRKAWDNSSDLVPGKIAVPCGLIAKTFFNDTYTFYRNNELLEVNEHDISFEKDRKLYKNIDKSRQWIDMTDEHFLVWMRPSGLPNPRKLWGKISQDLKKGEIIDVTINNLYDVSYYSGKKKIVLSNATKFGGKNNFLGISYIVVGCISILCAIGFPIGYKIQQEKEKKL